MSVNENDLTLEKMLEARRIIFGAALPTEFLIWNKGRRLTAWDAARMEFNLKQERKNHEKRDD